MTQAQQIVDLFDSNGRVWKTLDGRSLDEVCEASGGIKIYRGEEWSWEAYKYNFGDGSAIRVSGAAWGIGYPDCFCWAGLGHGEGCERVEGCPSAKPFLDYQVLEDNGGGLHLALFDVVGKCTHFMSGFETQPGVLTHTIQRLQQGAHPDTCEGLSPDPQGKYDALTECQCGWCDVGATEDEYDSLTCECGWMIVADTDGKFYDRMRASAKREFSRE